MFKSLKSAWFVRMLSSAHCLPNSIFELMLLFGTAFTIDDPAFEMTAIEYPGVDNDISPSALTAIWTGASIAIIVVVVRTFTQAKIVGRVGIDDYLMILSLVRSLIEWDQL